MAHLTCSLVIPAPVKETFEFFTDPLRIPSLLEDKLEVEVENGGAELQKGAEYSYLMTRAGISQYVRFRVEDLSRGNFLTYRQIEGIFRQWVHTQKFSPHGRNQTLITDIVDYELPFGLIGHLLDDLLFRKDLLNILQRRLHKGFHHFSGLYTNNESMSESAETTSDSADSHDRPETNQEPKI